MGDKRRYLVCHSYGMGGLWWWVRAGSADEILDAIAEVEVITDQEIIDRMVADGVEIAEFELAGLQADSALAKLADRRVGQRRHPAYGVMVGRTPFHIRTEGAQVVVLTEIGESSQPGRIVRQWRDGRAERFESRPMVGTFDIRDPELPDLLIDADEFEFTWQLAGSPAAPRAVKDLVEGIAAGERYKYVFFWGHTPRRVGQVDGSCFSQWYPAEFTVDGVTYRTAEHWMMAAKARMFGDEETAARVIAARHPGEAKALGRAVADFDEVEWRRERFAVVVTGSLHKFGQNAELAKYLAGTTGRVLVEASPVDRVWGTGLAAGDERSADPAQWLGENLLGFALMAARETLGDAT